MSGKLSADLPELVVVTGASSGLGTAICAHLIASKVKVIGVDLGAAPDLGKAVGYEHVKGDVTSEDFWKSFAGKLEKSAAKSLGLVTSAAILDVGTIVEFDKAMMEKTLSVNIIGTALAMKTVIPRMIALKSGVIVAVGSVDATFAEQQLSVYAASKGAVRQLTRTVAMDHARQGIRANVLSPGPMMAGLFERHMKSANDPKLFEATRAARQPNGRILPAGDVADVALFLLSDASRAINGAELIADGGLTTSFDFRTGSEGASIS